MLEAVDVRGKLLTIRMTSEEHARAERLAEVSRTTTSELVRRLLADEEQRRARELHAEDARRERHRVADLERVGFYADLSGVPGLVVSRTPNDNDNFITISDGSKTITTHSPHAAIDDLGAWPDSKFLVRFERILGPGFSAEREQEAFDAWRSDRAKFLRSLTGAEKKQAKRSKD